MSTGVSFHQPPVPREERREFYARLAAKSSRPLWEVFSSLFTPAPNDRTRPILWRYRDMRPLISEAACLISPEEAERRVLVLENPGLPGSSQVTQTLYAGLQMIAPGETAPPHRHVSAALRYVMEGEGAYTAVNGERAYMRPGDFILTPSWQWHEHGNSGGSEVIWLDGLDMPIANFFCTSFAEKYPDPTQPVEHEPGHALHRFGMGLLPLEYKPQTASAPIFVYPFERSQQALRVLSKGGERNPWHGVKMQYVNPVTGGSPMPTISAFLQLLPAGFCGRSYRCTDATVYCASEGSGRTFIGDTVFAWGQNDVFVVPSWQTVHHEAETEAILFSFSDRVAQKALGIWREEHLGAELESEIR